MKTDRNILIAFLLNFCFSVFEFLGGTFTGSFAIMSDAVHDLGDALSIGISWFLERKSKKAPDEVYTYGYARYSVVGGVITTVVLLTGSVLIIIYSVGRLIHPVRVNYNGMLILAVIGLVVNSIAAFVTKEGDSVNQKAVNLHMFEDVFGWAVVLISAVVMKFTDISVIDPILSIAVSLVILFNAIKNLKEILDIFLEKTPNGIKISEITAHLTEIDGVVSVHHIHIWTMDGANNYATLHAVIEGNAETVKLKIKEELTEHGIGHTTVETETPDEKCTEESCSGKELHPPAHHHHHHH